MGFVGIVAILDVAVDIVDTADIVDIVDTVDIVDIVDTVDIADIVDTVDIVAQCGHCGLLRLSTLLTRERAVVK